MKMKTHLDDGLGGLSRLLFMWNRVKWKQLEKKWLGLRRSGCEGIGSCGCLRGRLSILFSVEKPQR